MADLYVCPACPASWSTMTPEGLVHHAEIAHDHRPDVPDCDCPVCRAGTEASDG